MNAVIYARYSSESQREEPIDGQIRECEKGIENLLNAIQTGILTASTKDRLEKLEQQKETLSISLVDLKIRRPVYTKEQIVTWISQFRYGNIQDIEYQKEIIFRDGTHTVTKQELDAVLRSDFFMLNGESKPCPSQPPKRKTALREKSRRAVLQTYFILMDSITGWALLSTVPLSSRT